MKVEAEQVLCRFHLSSFVRHRDEPLYQWIVEVARHEGLQGATVLDDNIIRTRANPRLSFARLV